MKKSQRILSLFDEPHKTALFRLTYLGIPENVNRAILTRAAKYANSINSFGPIFDFPYRIDYRESGPIGLFHPFKESDSA